MYVPCHAATLPRPGKNGKLFYRRICRGCLNFAMADQPLDLIDPFDDCEWLPARDLFHKLGFMPLPPAVIDDFQMRGRLWEFIYALAGRRFYLHDSNHLNDRELYLWLYDHWFKEEVADIPFEAKWNCHVGVLDVENENERDKQIHLRFFATEKEREEWAVLNPGKGLPPRQSAPHDRDRWLPEPPGFPPDTGDEPLFFEDDEPEYDESDPLGLEAVDAQIAGQKERDQSTDAGGSQPSENWQRPVDQLNSTGCILLPPAELTDETLPAKLWELLHNLALQGFYVSHTDHLSDRDIYNELWARGMREEALLPGKCRTGGWFHDFLGSWSEDDMQLWLRYYATDKERAEHAKEYPEDNLPPKEKPPFNRDWRLPKGPF
jgi:hypothetical protein